MLKFVETVFVSSIISSHVMTESSITLAKYFSFSQRHVTGVQIGYFLHTLCFFRFLHCYRHLLLFHFWFELYFLPLHLHLHSNDNHAAVLFETHTLLDRSLKVLHLSTNLSKLTRSS